jgi:putative hydrolase of the HAD superfamily
MTLDAIIFDFDGLIIDTEATVLQSWQEVYARYGVDLPVQDGWVKCIGSEYGPHTFDPVAYLNDRVSDPIDWRALQKARDAREMELVNTLPPLPGVLDLLDEARAINLTVAIGSSSPHSWVDAHLNRLGLFDRFAAVICADDVAAVKPAPDLFIRAAEAINVAPENAVVLEDSPHGITAAARAGIAGVAVPNGLTQYLDFNGAALRVASMTEINVARLQDVVNNHR